MPPLVPVLSNILEQVPAAALDMLRGSIEGIISNLPSIMQLLTQFVTTTSSAGTSSIVSKVIERFTTDAVGWLERFRPFLESSVSGGANTLSFIPPEILLIVPAINKKVALGTASAMELVVAALIHDVQALFSMNETTAPKLPTEAPPKPHGVPMQEVQRKFTALAATLPMLCDVDTLFRSLEIPALAQRAIRSFWAASRPPGSSTQSASDVVKVIIHQWLLTKRYLYHFRTSLLPSPSGWYHIWTPARGLGSRQQLMKSSNKKLSRHPYNRSLTLPPHPRASLARIACRCGPVHSWLCWDHAACTSTEWWCSS